MATGTDTDRDAGETNGPTDTDGEDYGIHGGEAAAGDEMPAVDVGTAAASVWYLWVVAVISAVVAAFFATSVVVSTPAEPFYALIFAGVAVAAAGYGLYTVRQKTRPF